MKTINNKLKTILAYIKPTLLGGLVGIFLLTSCSNDDDGFLPGPTPEAGNKIKFEIGFAPQNDGKPQTRVATDAQFKSIWENGDQIGIFAVKRAASDTKALAASGNYMHNVKLTYNSTEDKWTGEAYYYPQDGEVLDFHAYYPYDDNGGSPQELDPTNMTFAVKADQSGTNYNQSDLLSAKTQGIAKGDAGNLQFNHMLSLVQVEFESGGRGANIDALSTVTMKAIATTKTFSLSATSIEASTGVVSDIVMTKVNGLPNTYRALVPAQTIATNKTLFTVTCGGRLVYTTSADTTLTQAKAVKYKITLVAPATDPNHVYAIGDYYPHGGLAEGIVYEISNAGKNGKIVSLDEGTNLIWNQWKSDAKAKNMDNGIANMNGIKNNPNGKPFRCYNWVHAKNSPTEDYSNNAAIGIWYQPARNELSALYTAYAANKPAFNDKLTTAGGTALSTSLYWSSSENGDIDAWGVSFSGNDPRIYNKRYGYSVRAVSAF